MAMFFSTVCVYMGAVTARLSMILTMVLFIYLYLKHTKVRMPKIQFFILIFNLWANQGGGKADQWVGCVVRTFPAYVGVAIRSLYYCLYC